jgi:hypothetical protein
MARHALILINASPIFCGQHSMMDGSDRRSCLFRWCPERFLNNHSGNDGRATALRQQRRDDVTI